MAATDYAIVVGVSSYPRLDSLGGPAHDARAFRDWLLKPGGGNIPKERVRLVASDEPPGLPPDRPRADDVQAEFDTLVDLAEKNAGHVGRRLYIYLAGHGFGPTIDDAALLMANASRTMTGYNLSGREYANWFRKAFHFDEIVLLMDCCREDYPLAPVPRVPYQVVVDANNRLSSKVFVFATQPGMAAREVDTKDSKGKTVRRGLFTLSLIAGLEGGAALETGEITGESLRKFVILDMARRAKELKLDAPQDPYFDPDGATVVLRAGLASKLGTVRADVGAAAPAAVKLMDGNLQNINPTQKAGTTWDWQVPAQRLYVLQVGPKSIPVTVVGAGEVVHVSV